MNKNKLRSSIQKIESENPIMKSSWQVSQRKTHLQWAFHLLTPSMPAWIF
jgi:hypothetical protein